MSTINQQPTTNNQQSSNIMTKQAFDLIRLNICGNTFIVPRDAGMAVFNLFANHDVYHQRYKWVSGGDSYQYAALVEEGAVKLESIGAVEFVKLRAEAEAREQRLAAERKAKEKA
jgi:hypothetical protein